MNKIVWGSKTGLWVDHILSEQDTKIITVILSTKGHGGCIKVYGTDSEIMERVNTILNAFNQEEPIHEN